MRTKPQAIINRDFPKTVEQFLDELERRFPEYRVTPTSEPEEIMFRAGQRSVVHQMREAYQASQKRDPGL
jgi:hypothetical protein